LKHLVPLSVYCLFFAWLGLSWKPANEKIHTGSPVSIHTISGIESSEFPDNPYASLYEAADLKTLGLSRAAFDYACKGYTELMEKKQVRRDDYLTICDFSQSARRKRMYVIDMQEQRVLINTYVAHGRNSGSEYATRFSNRAESHQSSLGFYVTRNTYYGEHGLSLRVTGMEPGFNDLAMQRAIVVHGASYIGAGSMGRSYGCPAVPQKESRRIIQTIQGGTCLFIYHPSKQYLTTSKILND